MNRVYIVFCWLLGINTLYAGSMQQYEILTRRFANNQKAHLDTYFQAIMQNDNAAYNRIEKQIIGKRELEQFLAYTIWYAVEKQDRFCTSKVTKFLWDNHATKENAARVVYVIRRYYIPKVQDELMTIKQDGNTYNNQIKLQCYKELLTYIARSDAAPHNELMTTAFSLGDLDLMARVVQHSPLHAQKVKGVLEEVKNTLQVHKNGEE